MEAARQLPELFARRRSEQTIRELEQLRPLGEAYLLRRFGGQVARADAEDAVAEVVIRLHRRIEAGQPPRNLRAAFFTSARNAAIDQLRSRAARPTAPLELIADAPAGDAPPSERAVAREEAIRLQEALGRMRPNYREAIFLRFGLSLTVPEIAARLDISLPAAKKLVLRATEQARKRLQGIEAAEFCPDAQDLARRSLADKHLSGLASPEEQRLLQNHLRHCGRCRSFLAELRGGLHELGGAALLAGAAGQGLQPHLGIADHLGRWLGHVSDTLHAATAKLRPLAYKLGGAIGGPDATSAGALTGTAQKALALCGAATATTATCLATGVIGPGLGANATSHADTARRSAAATHLVEAAPEPVPPQQWRDSAPAAEVPPPPEPSPQPQPESRSTTEPNAPPSEPVTEPEPTPSQQSSQEFGFESGAPPPESAPAPEPAPAPAPSSAPAPSGGGGGGESFGFGG
jgi:RNA polymerase sigma factor (sigma-70 family)